MIVGAAVLGAVAVRSVNRSPNPAIPIMGVPSGVLIFIGLVVVFDLILRRTRFGRHIFTVGGNAEAARRASLNVDRIRMAVFVLGSLLAAAGGILAAARLFAVKSGFGLGRCAAQCHRGRRHLWNQPLWWARKRLVCPFGCTRDRWHLQWDGFARTVFLDQVHDYRRRAADCGHHRCPRPSEAGRDRPLIATISTSLISVSNLIGCIASS